MFGFGKQNIENKVRDGAAAYALKAVIQMVENECAYHGKGCLWLMVNAGALKNSVFCAYVNGWMQGYLKKCSTPDSEMRKIWTNFLVRDLGPSVGLWHSELGSDYDIDAVARLGFSTDASSTIARAEGINDGAKTCAAMLDWERYGNPPSGIAPFYWLSDQLRTKNSLSVDTLRKHMELDPQSAEARMFRKLGFRP